MPIVEDSGTCELYPFCQQHSVLQTLSSLFDQKYDGEGQLSQRAPYTQLHFMGNVPEQKIA